MTAERVSILVGILTNSAVANSAVAIDGFKSGALPAITAAKRGRVSRAARGLALALFGN